MDKFALTPTQLAAFSVLDGEKQAYFLELAKRARGFTFLLWGRPGSGKSYALRALSKSLSAPIYVVDLDGKGGIDGTIGETPKRPGGSLCAAWATRSAANLRKAMSTAAKRAAAGECSGLALDTYTTYNQNTRAAIVDDTPPENDKDRQNRIRQYQDANLIHGRNAAIFDQVVSSMARSCSAPGPVVGVVSAHATEIEEKFKFVGWRLDLSKKTREAWHRGVAYSLFFDPTAKPSDAVKFRFEWQASKHPHCKSKAETDREQGIIAECAKTSDLARMVQDLYECRIDMALAQAKAG